MTIHKRLDNSPGALPKKVADLARRMEQDRAASSLRIGAVGGRATVASTTATEAAMVAADALTVARTPNVAPFPNADFEDVSDSGGVPAGWTLEPHPGLGLPPLTADTSEKLSGSQSLALNTSAGDHLGGGLTSEQWLVPEGSTVTPTVYSKRTAQGAGFSIGIVSNVASGDATEGAPGAVVTDVLATDTSLDWTAQTVSLALPPGHTKVRLRITVETLGFTTAPGSLWIDSVGVVSSFVRHDDFMRRAQSALILANRGKRSVDGSGNISWTKWFAIEGVGRQPDEAAQGSFRITMPANGAVIPVHGSTIRTSYTVASTQIHLDWGEALWYRLDFGTDTGTFHILGSANYGSDYRVDQGWILVCATSNPLPGGSFDAPAYRWGDGQTQNIAAVAAGQIVLGTNVVESGEGVDVYQSGGTGILAVYLQVTAAKVADATLFTVPETFWPRRTMRPLMYAAPGGVVPVAFEAGTGKFQIGSSGLASGALLYGTVPYPI